MVVDKEQLDLYMKVEQRHTKDVENAYKLGQLDILEKLKAELDKIYPMNGYYVLSSRAAGKSAGYGIRMAQEIIDKHISELKGEPRK